MASLRTVLLRYKMWTMAKHTSYINKFPFQFLTTSLPSFYRRRGPPVVQIKNYNAGLDRLKSLQKRHGHRTVKQSGCQIGVFRRTQCLHILRKWSKIHLNIVIPPSLSSLAGFSAQNSFIMSHFMYYPSGPHTPPISAPSITTPSTTCLHWLFSTNPLIHNSIR